MRDKSLGLSKAFMCCSNIVFLMSGFVLMSLGALLLADGERVLLSRLLGTGGTPQPLFYYVALSIVAVGFLVAVAGILGCWASCLHNCCITATYASVIVLLLLGKCALCVTVVFWPRLLGVDTEAPRLARALQRSYALPGSEQLTAALDLAQAHFSCCGVNGSGDYAGSWWRAQEVGRRELRVPLSCCALNNSREPEAFLNPEPRNLSLCQRLDEQPHLQPHRHDGGCLELIEDWAQEQALILLAIGLVALLIELSALLSTLLACSSRRRGTGAIVQGASTSTQTLSPFAEPEYGLGSLEQRLTLADARNTFKS